MNVGSLFSGAGLLDYGLTLAGFDHTWFCERDAYCRQLLELRWPGVPIYDDVRTISGAQTVDVLAGGFPCQPVSDAGKKLAQADERWLWPHFERCIRDLRPRYVLVENVPGLARRGLGIVVGDLAALGYDAEWDCVSAAAVGAPHLRSRLFLVAYPHEERCDRRPRIFGETWRAELADSGRVVQDTDRGAVESRWQWRRATQAGGAKWWPVEPDMGRVAYGVPHRLDRLAGLGNGVVVPVGQWIGERIMTDHLGRSRYPSSFAAPENPVPVPAVVTEEKPQ